MKIKLKYNENEEKVAWSLKSFLESFEGFEVSLEPNHPDYVN